MPVLVTASQLELHGDDLADWGFRPGAKEEGTCHLRGRMLSTANEVKTGIWECTPGAFDVLNRPNVESIVIIKGKVKLTDLSTGAEKVLGAGDCAVLEFGSSVKWEILETTRKFFVVAPVQTSSL
ncbi:hypothetical protein CYMTET_40762 [Cymbomonas tetramitiformis]|uniref:(S)-ureidoglycine aminohydrolase cupin domain-containing protein n=1 Tax=Cymbomonas tetramitiformis TaxID=36881 RepID=A0AAE0C8S8_9CHLO|nr:hypothetical protein CYMTET_40762 [Cymbomonas tetramitiformis]